MILTNLRVNELSADGWASYQAYLDALDRYDIEAFAGGGSVQQRPPADTDGH